MTHRNKTKDLIQRFVNEPYIIKNVEKCSTLIEVNALQTYKRKSFKDFLDRLEMLIEIKGDSLSRVEYYYTLYQILKYKEMLMFKE